MIESNPNVSPPGKFDRTHGSLTLPAGEYTLTADRRLITRGDKADNADGNGSWLSRAVGHLETGDIDAALQAASKACHETPGDPRSHYAYGQAWAALGRNAEAERAFAAALQIAPSWADAWVNYGLARYRQGSMDDAVTAMRHALQHEPDHAGANVNLGTFLFLTGNAQDGEALLLTTLADGRDSIAARLNLAANHLKDERSDEALALLDGIVLPDDLLAVRHIHLARALAHLQKGRATQAAAALADCAALGPMSAALAPLWHWRHLLLALVEGDEPRARAEAERTEQALAAMGPDAVPEHRIMTYYELAKFWSGLGARRRAFGLWTAAHRLLAQSQPFSREAHSALLAANIKTFSRRRLALGSRAANSDPTPVFIVGMPRSGTTLCEEILAAHRDVHAAGERSDLERVMRRFGGDTPSAVARLAQLDSASLDAAAQLYLAELRALAPNKARIIDKMPHNYLRLGLIGLMLPGARIIHCVRDPRDIGLSIYTLRFFGIHSYAHDLGDLGWAIRQQEQLMAHWKAVLPNPILTVALSDWVQDFDVTLARVLSYLDLPHDPACVRFHERDSQVRTASRVQVRQPINARGLGRWRPYAKELAPLIAELDIVDVGTVEDAICDSHEQSNVRVLTVADPARALGLATHFLMTKPVFARLGFGEWAQILTAQVERGHYRLFVDGAGRICGFLGWALTDRISAEDWISGRRILHSTVCRAGNCVIVNAWAANNRVVNRCMVDEMRPVVDNKTMMYFKRYYPDGRTRPVRLPPTDFLRKHMERALAKRTTEPIISQGASDNLVDTI